MRRLGVWLMAVAGLVGCAEPEVLGQCFPGFLSNPTRLMALERAASAFTINQPVATCGLDPKKVYATVVLIRPDNTSFKPEVEWTPYNPFTANSSAKVFFTPDLVGTWQVIVTFEPSIGRLQIPIDVAKAVERPRHEVTLPIPAIQCANQPWRTTAGATFCESQGTLLGQRGDRVPNVGGPDDLSFRGSQLVVVGNTLWSLSSSHLTRRTDTGTALHVDATSTTTYTSLQMRHASETSVVFADDFGIMRRVDFVDGGLRNVFISASTEDLVFSDSEKVWWRAGFGSEVCPLDQSSEPSDGGVRCRSAPLTEPKLHSDDGLWLADFSRPATATANGDSTAMVLLQSPIGSGRMLELPIFESHQPFISAAGPLLRGRETLVLRNVFDPSPLFVRVVDHELVYVSYGPGTVLGTRGDFIVFEGAQPFTVAFLAP